MMCVPSTQFYVNDDTCVSIDGPPPVTPEWCTLRVVKNSEADGFAVHYQLCDCPPQLKEDFVHLMDMLDQTIAKLLAQSRWARLSAPKEVVLAHLARK